MIVSTVEPIPSTATPSVPYVGFQTLTDAATIAFDASLGPNGVVTLGGNRTLAKPTNIIAGVGGVLEIIQDGTGSRTLAYASGWIFPGGVAPTLSTAAGTKDALSWWPDGTNVLGVLTKAFA